MKDKELSIIIISFIVFILNIIVFFIMGSYVESNNSFGNMAMYYLNIFIIIGSGLLSYAGYRGVKKLDSTKRIVSHIIFWSHLISLAIFLGTIWYIVT